MPVLANEGLLLQMYGKSLQMSGQNHEAIKVLEKSRLLTTDQVIYTTVGDAYRGIGQYDKAENDYQFAVYM